jgi:ribosome-binding protein aMBF1 (putative translation factor)
MNSDNIDTEKLEKLPTSRELLDSKYGKTGKVERAEFDTRALAWYYGELLGERRKQLGITQEKLAAEVGVKRSYISRIERGETDMQLSSLLRISKALGWTLTLG